MKKTLSVLLAVLLIMLMSLPAFADNILIGSGAPGNKQLLTDENKVLSDAEYTQLSGKMQELSSRYSFDFCVAFVDGIDGDIMTYTDNYFLNHGYGQGAALDGCLLLVDFDSKEYWLSTSGFGETAFTDYGINVIKERFGPLLSEGDYYSAVDMYLSTAEQYVSQAKQGSPYDVDNEFPGYPAKEYGNASSHNTVKGIAISLIVAVFIALVVVMSIKKSYKEIQFQRSAANYLDEGSLSLTNSYDRFLYTTISKTKRESESRSSGGSSTHSTSGHSFGGGGGKF